MLYLRLQHLDPGTRLWLGVAKEKSIYRRYALKTALAFIVTVIILPLLVINFAASDAKYKTLEQRGLVEVERQSQPVVPYRPDIQFTVAAHPTAITKDFSWAILTGSDSSSVNALVFADVRQGMVLVLFQYAELDAENRAHAYVLIGSIPCQQVEPQTPYNHLSN